MPSPLAELYLRNPSCPAAERQPLHGAAALLVGVIEQALADSRAHATRGEGTWIAHHAEQLKLEARTFLRGHGLWPFLDLLGIDRGMWRDRALPALEQEWAACDAASVLHRRRSRFHQGGRTARPPAGRAAA